MSITVSDLMIIDSGCFTFSLVIDREISFCLHRDRTAYEMITQFEINSQQMMILIKFIEQEG